MMVVSGLSADLGLVASPGNAPGVEATPEAAFDRLLATLGIGAAGPAASELAPQMPVTVRVVAEVDSEAEPSAQGKAEQADDPSDGKAADIVAQPFVAPPVVIAMIGGSAPVPAATALAQPLVGQALAPSTDAVASPVAPAVVTGDTAQPVAVPVTSTKAAAPVADILKALGLATPHARGKVIAQQPMLPEPSGKDSAPAKAGGQSVVQELDPGLLRGTPERLTVGVAAEQPHVSQPIPTPPVTTAPDQPALVEAPVADTAQRLGEQGVRVRLDIADEARMIDRLARDIAQLSGGDGRLKFQLNPEHLGSLHVEIAQGSEGVSLRFGAETEGARAILADAQHRLANEARAQGMRIAETHVDLGSQHQGGSRSSHAPQRYEPVIATRGQAPDIVEPAETRGSGPVERFA